MNNKFCIQFQVGGYFDVAVQSLGLKLKLPVVSGGTFREFITVDFFRPEGRPCYVCTSGERRKDLLEKLSTEKIDKISNLEFLPHDPKPIGASNVYVASTCSNLMVASYVQYLMKNPEVPTRLMLYLNTFEIEKWKLEGDPECPLCGKSARHVYEDEFLFFGKKPIYVKQVEGEVKLSAIGGKYDLSEKSVDLVLQHCVQPLHEFGEEYSKVIIPGIPSADVIPEFSDQKVADVLPKLLQKPLLKTPEPGLDLIGFASGIRSGTLKIGDKWYRLKGCGNNDQGFIVRNAIVFGETKYHELRGCMFENTVYREQHMVRMISDIMSKNQVRLANVPSAIFKYKLENEIIPKLPKYCAVYETRSDARLGNDLFPGLEVLIGLMVSDFDNEKLIKMFGDSRFPKDSSSPKKTTQAMFEHLELVNLFDFDITEIAPEKVPNFVDQGWAKIWEENAKIFNKAVSDKIYPHSFFAFLFYKLGWETGKIMRLIKDNNISWGTFWDEFLFSMHCNAHCDNLIVMPQEKKGQTILAPWDFDFAYTRDTFLFKENGVRDDDKFNNWCDMEVRELAKTLGGDQNFDFGFKVVDLNEKSSLIRTALRDTCVKGYYHGFDLKELNYDLNIDDAVYALIRLALIVSPSELNN